MQKKNINLKNNKGIALITLLVAVLMLLIISSIVIYNSTSHYRISNLNKMYNDIHLLNEQVFLYYSKYEELPIIENKYGDGSDVSLSELIMGKGEEAYEDENFHIIDINKIDRNIKSNLNYGKDYYDGKFDGQDIYIINELTHQIFYVQGLKSDDTTTYYTIPGENEYTDITITNLAANIPVLKEDLDPVIQSTNEDGQQKISGTTTYDKNWYDYSNTSDLSKWARARGDSDADLYMWIPRYAYNKKTNEPVDNKKDITSEEWIIPNAFQNKEKEQLTGIWLSIGNEYNKINSKVDLITAVYELTGKYNINGKENISITGKEYPYYNPVIPVGFKTVPTKDASWNSTNGIQVDGWNDGLVIEDKDGNQFVWVPVDGTNVKYERWQPTQNGNRIVDNVIGDKLPDNVENESNQINIYGGFYIARYEAGIPSNGNLANTISRNVIGVPVSKKNQIPWNYINCANSKINAEKMFINDYVQSGLVTGIQWDTIMKWLENSEINVQTNSSDWGNYYNVAVTGITEYLINGEENWKRENVPVTKGNNDYWIIKTGNSEYTKRKNIYDLAGNLYEWTSEIMQEGEKKVVVRRGGYFSKNNPAAFAWCNEDFIHITQGFRVVLFIK